MNVLLDTCVIVYLYLCFWLFHKMIINVFVLIYFIMRKNYDNSIFESEHRKTTSWESKRRDWKVCARKNLTINRWVTEVVSGKKKEHDRKLGRLLKSLKKGDILIVTELSRLSRTLLDIMSILHRCLEMNITVLVQKTVMLLIIVLIVKSWLLLLPWWRKSNIIWSRWERKRL